MRKYLFLSLLLVLAVSVVGCGGSGGGASPDPTPTPGGEEFSEFSTSEKVYLAAGITLPNFALDIVSSFSGDISSKSISLKEAASTECANDGGSAGMSEDETTVTFSNCQLPDHTEYTVTGTITASTETLYGSSYHMYEYDLTGSVVYDSSTYNISLSGTGVGYDDSFYVDVVLVAEGVSYYMSGALTASGSTINGPLNVVYGSTAATCTFSDFDLSTMTLALAMAEYGTANCVDATENSAFNFLDAVKLAVGNSAGTAGYLGGAGLDGGGNPCKTGSASSEEGLITFEDCMIFSNGSYFTLDGTVTGGLDEGVLTYNYNLDVTVEYGGTEYEYNYNCIQTASDSGEEGITAMTADCEWTFGDDVFTMDADSLLLSGDSGLLNGAYSAVTGDVNATCTMTDFDSGHASIYDYMEFYLSSACVAAE